MPAPALDTLPPGYRVVVPDDPATRTGPWCNRLARSDSPYLRQHADNPVDWWPWGPAALARARALDRPVFLSIGYAACHWCHVMERESFRDPAVAALLNGLYVPVKVDREEHPEVDGLYMEALVRLTGEGGWPASLWLTPEGVPFQGGTYFPPTFRYGTPAFREVLRRGAECWSSARGAVQQQAARLQAELEPAGAGDPPADALAAAQARLDAEWDARDGGWGAGAKFPQVPRLDLLVELAAAGQPAARQQLAQALWAMARGGIHDHVGGGFHRYAVDPAWAVPHFEKMLGDNALLARLYARASRLLGEPAWGRVAGTTLEWMIRELSLSDGAFAASLDAEAGAEGLEGEPYTWTRDQLRAAVGEVRARALALAYDVGEHPNWEGPGSVLRLRHGDGSLLAGARSALLAARARRPQPAVDDKPVVAWNGMAASALAEAGRLLGHAPWLERAARLGELLLEARLPDGTMPRLLGRRDGGVIEDQAQVVEALLDLHRATGRARFLRGAVELAAAALKRYRGAGGLLQAPADRPGLFARRVAWEEGAEPAGCALLLLQVHRLHHLGAGLLDEAGQRALLAGAAPALADHPHGLPTTLRLLRRLDLPGETVVVGGDDPWGLHAALRRHLLLEVEVVVQEPGAALPPLGVLEGKPGAGPARAWRCEGTHCGLPARTAAAIDGWWPAQPGGGASEGNPGGARSM